MKKYKFINDTFDFDLTLIIHNGSDKHRKKLCKKAKQLGYSKKDFKNIIGSSNAVVFGGVFFAILAFDANSFDSHRDEDKTIEMISVLQHECNHVKENVLTDISEANQHRETECAMRISDWCFKKCMNTEFFKSLLK